MATFGRPVQPNDPEVAIHARRAGMLTRMAIFYAVFITSALGLILFSAWQLASGLAARATLLSTPALLVLLLGGAGLMLEFYLGLKADLNDLQSNRNWQG